MIYHPRKNYTQKKWKNGLGVTEEIYVYPQNAEDFLFRLSMAALTESGPFSLYPGIDRTLVLIEGESIKLNDRKLSLFEPVSFKGEENIHSTLTSQGRDFNLMLRRGKVSGRVEVASGSEKIRERGDLFAIFSLCPQMSVSGMSLNLYDTCLIEKHDRGIEVSGGRYLKIYLTIMRDSN